MFPAPAANRGWALDENIEVRLMICTTARARAKWRPRDSGSLVVGGFGVQTYSDAKSSGVEIIRYSLYRR